MVESSLVNAVRALLAELDLEFGSVEVAALLPASTESVEEDESAFALILAAGWVDDRTVSSLLVRIIELLNRVVAPLQRHLINRVVILPMDDGFVEALRARYSSAWEQSPIPLAEENVSGRLTRGGTLIRLTTAAPVSSAEHVQANTLTQVIDLTEEEIRQFEPNDLVANSPISPKREGAFRDKLRTDRTKSSATFEIFRNAGMYEAVADRDGIQQYGLFRQLMRKGPFVDRSSWADLDPWPIAVSLERYLHSRICDVLTNAVIDNAASASSWDELRAAVTARTVGDEPRKWVLLLTSDVVTDFYIGIAKDLNVTNDRGLGPWHLGTVNGMAIMRLLAEPPESSVAYLVQVGELGRIRQYILPDGATVEVSIEPIPEEEVERLSDDAAFLAKTPILQRVTRNLRQQWLRERVEMNISEWSQLTSRDAPRATRIQITAENLEPALRGRRGQKA